MDLLFLWKNNGMNLENHLKTLYQNIATAESQFHRKPNSVKLLAVSKTQSIANIQEAFKCGQKAFGENYLQEALLKIDALQNMDIEWHFIGPIQSNKTRKIAENFSWVHSIDRMIIAQRLNEQRPLNLPPLNICIQINFENEITKSGISTQDVIPFIQAIQKMPRLKLCGFMIIPEFSEDFEKQRQVFHELNQLLHQINQQLDLSLDTLSMGMSNDYIAAIAEGSTIIRVGTALFGERRKSTKDF